jgi:hypothetical protein
LTHRVLFEILDVKDSMEVNPECVDLIVVECNRLMLASGLIDVAVQGIDTHLEFLFNQVQSVQWGSREGVTEGKEHIRACIAFSV